ncbi:MAG: prepilin-type N-terminal cleavage/methylation domain-containing protein [Deltaproteobacteria bacterium]|nr:prepilin-type N-terminal cleavage/methylation domain-containing protein [Deltaproteobacteria bacterium]
MASVCPKIEKRRSCPELQQRGFTLLEVIITLTILVSMVYAITQMIRASFDVRYALGQEAMVTHRFNTIMEAFSRDIGHAFIVPSKDTVRAGGKARTVFKITKSMDSDSLALTYSAHQAIRAHAKEADLAYVVYQVRASKKDPSRKNLYRGETMRMPEDFRDDPPMAVLAEDIASLQFEAWNGDSWMRDKWDSTSSDTKDRLPQMVRVIVQAWTQNASDRTEDSKPDVQYTSVIYLPTALDFDELKQHTSSYKLD